MMKRYAVVGSGPAGFYTAYRLLERSPLAHIDMFEALPVPFGLARFGVAPDHPEVKNCEDTFTAAAESPNFKFYGNVKIGTDVSLQNLLDSYNGVVLSYGSSNERSLNVPGESLSGVWSAKEFVAWYNGDPRFAHLDPPLEDVEDVSIIGNGNVALDVARMLLAPIDLLKHTDISDAALQKLSQSRVKSVNIAARRGLLQSAFTTKEIRELTRLKSAYMTPLAEEYIEEYRPFMSKLARPIKRAVEVVDKASKLSKELLDRSSKESHLLPDKKWSLSYLQSPTRFFGHPTNPALLSAIEMTSNKLYKADLDAPVVTIPTGKTTIQNTDLVFKSIGYLSEPLPGMKEANIPFDEKRGIVPNKYGKVQDGLFVSGWLKTGATGVIATTMREAFEVAETIVAEPETEEQKPGFEAISGLVSNKAVSWDGWLKIDKEERRRGKALGKPREKILDVDEMLKIAFM